jgi:hypothetical protein
MISRALYDKNIRNQLRQISFKILLRVSERTINKKRREKERNWETYCTQRREASSWQRERKRKIVCDRMRIVSKEALVLIKLAPVFPQQYNHRSSIYPPFIDDERNEGERERKSVKYDRDISAWQNIFLRFFIYLDVILRHSSIIASNR